MKNSFKLGIIILSLSACNGGVGAPDSSDQNAMMADEIRRQDSLTLDSFKRAQAEEREWAVEQAHKNELQDQGVSIEREPTQSNAGSYATQDAPATQKKKGWSDAAKGTAIGAGVGAGVGALIDKDKRLRGAAIGAAIGGGSGYAIGRKSDRKSGRVQKK